MNKEAIWEKWERRLRLSMPPGFRESMERDYYEADSAAGNEREALLDLEGGIRDFVYKLRLLGYLPEAREPRKAKPAERNARALKKRLYLVDFVLKHQMANTARRPGLRRRAIDWKKICAAWNDANPLDATTPEVLKATYHRAIGDEFLQQAYYVGGDFNAAARFSERLAQLDEANQKSAQDGIRAWFHLVRTGDDGPFLENMRRAFEGRPLTTINTIEGFREFVKKQKGAQ